jgi:hypothetical protein
MDEMDKMELRMHFAENRVLCGVTSVDARIARTRQRGDWVGLTQEQMLAAFADQLLEIRTVLTGKAKS